MLRQRLPWGVVRDPQPSGRINNRTVFFGSLEGNGPWLAAYGFCNLAGYFKKIPEWNLLWAELIPLGEMGDQYLKREVMERVSSISPRPLIPSWLQSNIKVRTLAFNHPERAQASFLK
ncbi:hypothetical protein CDAR_216261 [Caerostris darwini]|uniref:Uncharacterized protein n=1 Tax=Caerostris darwini TaxID=1538125 RepID=A0AAV4SR85_9ARAC|nr:hypothetical protein CDAR_216261 [Caerostris darwini]